MSDLKTFEQNPSLAPKGPSALPEMLVSGDLKFKCWPRDADMNGRVTGVWEATAGVKHPFDTDTQRICCLLAGRIELSMQVVIARSWHSSC